jgi:hypothetical protein
LFVISDKASGESTEYQSKFSKCLFINHLSIKTFEDKNTDDSSVSKMPGGGEESSVMTDNEFYI